MNNRIIVSVIASAIIFGGGGYYFGTKATPSTTRGAGQFTGGNFAGRAGRGGGEGAVFGTVVAKDATSITVQLMGGPNASSTGQTGTGSKIVLFDTSTLIGKMVAGTSNDLTVGQSVVANGTANSDGSITAQMIQIRPAGTGPRGQ